MTDHDDTDRPTTPGGQPPEKVEDRPGVGQVRPDDYPEPADGSDAVGDADGPGESSQNYQPQGTAAGASKSS